MTDKLYSEIAAERSEIYKDYAVSKLFVNEFNKITKDFTQDEILKILLPGNILFSITFDLAMACCRYQINQLQANVDQLKHDILQIKEQPVIVNSSDPKKLTDIEKKVIKSFIEGKTGAAIAKELGLSAPTISYYHQKFTKMNIL